MANEIYGQNAAGKALLRIWEGDPRLRYNQGEQIICTTTKVDGDGGKRWVENAYNPAHAPDSGLWFDQGKMQKVGG